MNAIGKGDWVECIQNRTLSTMPPVGRLVVGQVYQVAATGYTGPDDGYPNHPWVRLTGVRLRPGKQGFRAEWFKPVYSPKAETLSHLLQPAPTERETA